MAIMETNKETNKKTKPKTDMPNTDRVRGNWNSHTTGVGEIGTTTMENYLAATTKAQQYMYV